MWELRDSQLTISQALNTGVLFNFQTAVYSQSALAAFRAIVHFTINVRSWLVWDPPPVEALIVRKYVPEGVAGGGVGGVGTVALEGEPEPPQAKANIVNTARQITRLRLWRFVPNARSPVPSRSPNVKAKSLGTRPRKAVAGAVVVTVTVNGVVFTPMFTVNGVTVQVAPVGTPEQERVVVPV
jgi:hypothetical protein